MTKNLFITGTGTDIGKTFISALIVKKLHDAGYRSAYYKAAVSGNVRDAQGHLIPGDAALVKKISHIPQEVSEMVPYIYENAVSPHLASRMEGSPVELSVVKDGYEKVKADHDFITMEGSGGILCPIRWDEQKIWLEDIIQALHMPCIIIAEAGLGTINSAVLTYEYMKQHGMKVKGFIFNHFHPGDIMEEDNKKMVEERTGLPVLACVQEGDIELNMPAEQLAELYEE